tara:strand:+ start:397 stop:1236 length:840 start_codon:yes stop_codon:yes gene_type:complete
MNGFLLVNKPKGISSNHIVQKIKKLLSAKKVGHLGTLDPLATGLLIIAINRATKFSSFFLESDKKYDVQIELGKSTDTDDLEGKVIFESNINPDREEIKKALLSFKGNSMQVPPFFSALKYKGKPLYKYARKGEYVKKEPRKITVHKIENIVINNNICKFSISCSKGTYIRSIARDLGEKLRSGAHMTALNRTKQQEFSISDAIDIQDVTSRDLISIEAAFKNLDSISISEENTKKFINGNRLHLKHNEEDCIKVFDEYKNFLGLGKISNNHLKHKQLV